MLCPVKINLGLEVFHRLPPEGYHCLASIFLPISFGDDILFEDAENDAFISENLLPPAEGADFEAVSERGDLSANLVWRALQSIDPGGRRGVAVRLRKRVPTGGGLGGGSSNAGAVLAYLMRRDSLDPDMVIRIAHGLGSDVPFFLFNRPMLVSGTGEVLNEIAVGAGRGILCLPGIHVNTGAAYQELKRPLQETPPPKSLSSLADAQRRALERSDWERVQSLKNDFEEPVFARHPELAAIKDALYRAGAGYASLSGSGSALFAFVATPETQADLLKELRPAFPLVTFQPFEFPAGNGLKSNTE